MSDKKDAATDQGVKAEETVAEPKSLSPDHAAPAPLPIPKPNVPHVDQEVAAQGATDPVDPIKQLEQAPGPAQPNSPLSQTIANTPNDTPVKPIIPGQSQDSHGGQETKLPGKSEEQAAPPRREEVLSEHTLQQVLKINVGQIDFGELLPGQILEENLIVMNTLSSTKVPFKIKVNCLTKEFDDLDEYVYSMRRPNNNETYNYNDTFLILLTAKSVSYYKVAIKVPNIKEEKEILGSIDLASNECQGQISIPIRAKIIVPAIKCEKMITLKSLGLPVVKLYMKTPKRQDFRINLKNMCKLNLIAELFILKNEKELLGLDFTFYPQNVNLPPNMPINFMMSAKCLANESEILNKEIHCVMVVKIKNSSAIFSYPIVILIGDGKPEGKVMS